MPLEIINLGSDEKLHMILSAPCFKQGHEKIHMGQ